MGSTVSGIAKGAGGMVSSWGGQLLGSGSSAGLFGTGQYHTDGASVDHSAFMPDQDEQSLVQALQNQAYGKTPSLAGMQLKQGLDQATTQSQAMAASQRGINPALAARLAAQSQAGMMQNANIQGAQLRAQEQQQGLGALTNELGSLRQSRQNEQALLSGNSNAASSINAQAYEGAGNRRQNMMQGVGSAMGLFKAHGGMIEPVQHLGFGGLVSGPQAGMQLHAQLAQPQQMLNPGAVSGGYAPVGAQSPDQINQRTYGMTQKLGAQSTPMGAPQGQASLGPQPPRMGDDWRALLGLPMAHGGQVPHMFAGGMSMEAGPDGGGADSSGYFDRLKDAWSAANDQNGDTKKSQPSHMPQLSQPTPSFSAPTAGAGDFDSELAGINQIAGRGVTPTPLKSMSGGGGGGLQGMMKLLPLLMAANHGGKVPGQANVQGDSLKNDRVPAVLSPGEIVLPRSIVAKGPDAAKKFVAAIIAKKGKSA